MSEEPATAPAEVVRTFVTAFSNEDTDGWVACLSDDVVLVEAPQFPGAGTRHGRDGVVGAVADWALTWGEMRFELSDLQSAGDRVLATGQMRMRAELTGIEFANPAAFVCRVHEGAIARAEIFLDVDEARASFERA
jgi:ketosteroid isomerase-like protein